MALSEPPRSISQAKPSAEHRDERSQLNAKPVLLDQCGSAILIFTRDEKFFDESRQEFWRPSKNVVYELGAAFFAYGDRIMAFKEKGLNFPTNFQNIGHIEFEPENLGSKTTDLLKELIWSGLVRITH
jgi:predicted nucleotide-binding protein